MMSSVFDPASDNLVIATRKEIVFIEDNVADYQTIAANAGAGRQVVILDSTRDGLQQIADAMKGLNGIDAVHVVTHGSEGRIGLGTLILDQSTVAQHKGALAAIGSSMSADGDILFYGCSVGAGQGADLIGQLAIATGADVGASNNATGGFSQGGDWNLEVASGSVETTPFVSSALAAQYQELLSITTPTTITFSGSDANAGVYGPSADYSYAIPGQPGYTLKVNGHLDGVRSYGSGYITASPGMSEDKITIGFNGGQTFTPTSLKVNGNMSYDQTLVFTGLRADGSEVTHTTVHVPVGASIGNFVTQTLSGFNNITTLVITPQAGNTIQFFQMDDMVFANVTAPDTTPPTLAITSSKSTLAAGDTAAITFTFSEDPGTSFTAADIAYNNGTLSALTGSGFTRNATFTPNAGIAGSTATISVATNKYADAANNFNTTSSSLSMTVDTVAPTVTITSNPSTVANNGTAAITFTFSEDPGTSFSAADVGVSNGSIGAITGSGMTRNATFTPSANLNGVAASVTVTDKSYADAAGNLGAAGTSPSITVDNVIPNAPTTPVLDPSTDKGVSSSDNITNWTTLQFTGSAEAGVTTVKLFDGATQIGSGSVTTGPYSITTSSLAPGVHTITAKAYDAAGNESNASGSVNVTVDTTPPTVSVSSSPSVLTAGGTAEVTFTFSDDPGTSFSWDGSAGDLTVSGGTLSAITGTGNTRHATFTPNANLDTGTATIAVKANSFSDTAGNTNATTASTSLTYDTKAPTLTITADNSSLKVGETTTIRFTFSDDPGAGFDNSSIAVSGGTLSTISTTGAVRTATFTPAANIDNGTASITVAGADYADAAGNTGANASKNISYDTQAPANPSAPVLASADDKGDSSTDGITNKGTLLFSGTADPGATVKLYDTDGTTQIGSGSADAGGVWNITTSALAAGAHTIKAKAFDAAGNFSALVSGSNVVIDTTAPTLSLSIISTPTTLKTGETATIRFTFSEDPGTSFSWDGSAGDIVVSGGTLSALTGSGATREAIFTPTANTDAGSASIRVLSGTYHDLAGNDGAASNNLTISYDTLAPSAPSTPTLASSDDSGASNSDGVTNDNTLSFSGSAASGTTVKLYDGATQIGSVTASGGTYTIPVAGLAAGGHTLTAQAFDAAGNASTASGALALTVDQTPPTTTVAGAALSSDSGVSNSDMITKIAEQTISGTLSANLAAGERVMVSLDNGATWNPATASAGANTWELANVTLAGSNTLKVKVEDLAGNGGTVYSHAYTLDQVAPSAPSTPDLDAASDSGSSSTDNITGVTVPGFSGTADVGAIVRLYDGGIEIGSVVAVDGTWHITTGNGYTMGPRVHFITAEASDLAGNAVGSSALEVTVRAAPTTTVASIALSNDSGAVGDFITNASPQTISGLLSANLAAGERVQVSLNGGASWTDATAAVGSKAWSTPAALTAGAHDIKVRVTNDVDVSGPVLTQAYTLDSVKPAVAITSDVSQLKIGDTANITFTFSEDPGTSFDDTDISVSGGTLSALSGSGLTRTAVFTPAANTNGGSASISIDAGKYEDIAGNTGLAGSSPSLSFDTLAPAAASAPDLDAASDKGDSSTDNLTNLTSLTFKGTAEAGATVKLYDSDGSTEIGSGTATGGNWTIATSTLGAGSHSVTAKVFDAAGNVSAASGATTVTIDTTAPTLAISSDASQLKIGETATITFTFSEDPGATFTWNGSTGDVTVSGGTLSAISGTGTVRTATFTPSANTNGGAASISVSAGSYRDAAGNDGAAGATPSLHFDTLAPAAPSTPDLATASDTGSSDSDNFTADTTPTFSGTAESGATVTLYDGATAIGSVVAAGGAWQITSDRSLSAGAHTITAKAVDAAGNAGAASSGLALQIITSGPATGVKEMALSLDSGTAGDFVTNTAAQTISGLLDAVLAGGERVQVSLDGGTVWHDAVSSSGSDAWSIAATLAAGAHDIKVRVIDAIDNTGPVHTQAYTLDSVKPAVTITNDVAQLKAGQTANITFTFSEDPGASFDDSDIEVSGGTLSAIAGNGLVRTAVFTPSADTNGGTASITIKADSYEDAAGNLGSAGAPPSLSFDTLAPAAPSTPDLHKDSDSGPSDSDDLTRDTALVFTGTAESGATVRLYDSDGSTEIGHATAAGGVWTITTAALAEGSHAITAKSFDAAGNASAASGAITVTVDTSDPAALAAPTLATASDSGASGDAITKVNAPTFSGSAEALAQVTLYDGAFVIGTVQAGADGAWQITAPALGDGVHAISARQVDRAGNASGAGAVFSLTVDTVAPAAPAAPSLKASSDTGSIGDGVTENAIPVIEGTALADTLVTLYETVGGSKLKLGSAMADGSGKWSVATTGLSIGTHVLSATQTDAAGNESAAGAGFTLRIAPPPVPIDLVDGMPVTVIPISLPGNVPGTAVSIPIVGAGRLESSGQPGVADIPLVKSGQGAPILLAQLPAGYGLSASGANLPAANAGDILIAAIKAATPGHAPSDQGHLTGNGQSFLAGLGTSGSLLVETVKPVSSAAPDGVLTLSGPAPGAGQSTALVIDTGGLTAGAAIALQQVNFAAVIGAANVSAGSGMILSGDGASQHFTVAAGGSGSVFAGGGNDILSVAAPAAAGPAPAAGVALLHGGAASDTATFSGARADYNIEYHNGYVMVSTRAAPDVKAMVVNVEQLQFSDASIAVQNSADMGTLAGIYQTVLGRQADVTGIEYWANVHQAGASWGAIALSMISSSEHAASHAGFNGVAAHDLALLYAAIFNREGDAGGMAYWSAELARGITLEQVASTFVESAEMVGHQRAATDWDFFVGR